jgi:hypothetical protein
MQDSEAKALLDYFVEKQPGTLKIITNEPRPNAKTDDARDPAYFVLKDVARVATHPVRTSHLVAYSKDDADYVETYGGGAFDLLVRLFEWQHFDPARPDVANLARDKAVAAIEASYATLHAVGQL